MSGEDASGAVLDVHLLGQESLTVAQTNPPAMAGSLEKSIAKASGKLPVHPARKPADIPKLPVPLFEVTLPPEPYYFSTDQLTEKPVVALDIPPNLALSLSGTSTRIAILRLLISESGEIDQVIIEGSNFSEEEQKLIEEACKQMKFEPGKLDGVPVKTEMRIEMMVEGIPPSNYSRSVH